MPAYTYRCPTPTTPACQTIIEHRCPITSQRPDTLPCTGCGGPARRAFHATPTILKGTGFYSTDNRRR